MMNTVVKRANRSGLKRPVALCLLLAALAVNLCFTFECWVVRDIDFIRKNRGLSRWDRIFYRYPAIMGKYTRFLKESFPTDAVVLVPPGGWPFGMAANMMFLEYFLEPRKVLTANRFDVDDDLLRWSREQGVTHIALCRGVYRYRADKSRDKIRNVERNRKYIRCVENTGLAANLMPENVTVRVRNLAIRMKDGSVRKLLGGEGTPRPACKLLKGSFFREGLVKKKCASAAGATLTISALYSSGKGEIVPEDLWALVLCEPAGDVASVTAEIWSDSPDSACIFAVMSDGEEEWMLRSGFNETDGAWQSIEIGNIAEKARASGAVGASIEYVGLCVRPLGWGYLTMEEKAIRNGLSSGGTRGGKAG